jgi:hypothetical protein
MCVLVRVCFIRLEEEIKIGAKLLAVVLVGFIASGQENESPHLNGEKAFARQKSYGPWHGQCEPLVAHVRTRQQIPLTWNRLKVTLLL